MQDRKTIRQMMRDKREKISETVRMTNAVMAAHSLETSEIFTQAQSIACYMTTKNEFNTLPIIELIWRYKKNCYLPVLDPVRQNELIFNLYDVDTPLVKDRFGILEPRINKLTTIDSEALDLVLMPLTAFDRRGHRIGSGGGYYDRTFAFLKEHKNRKPFLCGVAYGIQAVESIEPEEWDVNLQAILTEQGLRVFNQTI